MPAPPRPPPRNNPSSSTRDGNTLAASAHGGNTPNPETMPAVSTSRVQEISGAQPLPTEPAQPCRGLNLGKRGGLHASTCMPPFLIRHVAPWLKP